ncbi:protein PROTON GRADIENT REGULATION 5, chloroplastic-like [Gossypium australe]|uniref:Protein PROTON GRADIENT REGULATION 5, chloroplastic-like n=1 Tax=Gossypium australe TaxID=47621 RepID=A0A5B6VME7_9ROSI|nr:protein PROTON GRADIENT REGULATION 5, chloroplastic-like [Gossypium australe]
MRVLRDLNSIQYYPLGFTLTIVTLVLLECFTGLLRSFSMGSTNRQSGEEYGMLAKSILKHVGVGKAVKAQPIRRMLIKGKAYLLLLGWLLAKSLARKC